MERLFWFMLLVFAMIASPIAHERDMARNCHNNGNASAWTVNIECK